MKAIFTVLLGGYDTLNHAPNFKGWDCILITDSKPMDSKGWQVKSVEPSNNPAKESRRYKFLSHRYLHEYDLVCYVDANMKLIKEPPSNPIWFKHPKRSTVDSEAKAVIQLRKAPENVIRDQMLFYFSSGFPDNAGLYQNGFFVRSNRNTIQNKLMEKTFEICQRYSMRDQIALPYAMWSTKSRPENIRPNSVSRRFIAIQKHKKKESVKEEKKVQVHHITPGRSDKNFGKAVNQIVESLPDEDWICLRDIDTLPMYHEKFFQQCEEIANSREFDLVGCMTNRLGLHYQLINGRKSNDPNILAHRIIAKDLFEEHGSKVYPLNQTIGGLLMLFPKSIWLKAGKFPEGGIEIKGHFIDYIFCKQVKKIRGKIGIAKGIYLFHYYRFDNGENTRTAIDHLK